MHDSILNLPFGITAFGGHKFEDEFFADLAVMGVRETDVESWRVMDV